FGMSVGSSIAYVITQAGISKEITIADFDELDTTNLNRIFAGVHQVGLNKSVIAARKIYEDNPYANVRVLKKGITRNLLEKLLKARKIDCIVEEIDDMVMKIEIRKLARKYRVPVLMITDNGDWAVLTIERYDLGYKKIFEKDFDYWNRKARSCKTPKDFADIVVNDIVGGPDNVDPRMLKSVDKVLKKNFVSWPQLGTSAQLGAVAITVAIKKIVRKEDKKLFRRECLKVSHG
ncbi:ThiF family adenylyltransferase, partial [Patescibacteria group bacterium]|nr:ThiF family adenylyltransferase [Patescibacteria group bacterium]